MRYETLDSTSFALVHGAFVESFSDYVVPFQISERDLSEMLQRRGVRLDLSVGAFDGERLAGVTLNGFGPWGGAIGGYDSGTGVVPDMRSRGIAREMMKHSFDLLRNAGAERYVLEVIDSNHRAERVYRSIGFRETRGLLCWTFDNASDGPAIAITEGVEVPPEAGKAWVDAEPSWQNSPESLRRAGALRTVLTAHDAGGVAGFAVLFPGNGDLAQLAVKPEARGRGIGRALLSRAREIAARPLRILNTDESSRGVTAFLEACGAERFLRQIEMDIPLR